MLLVTANGIWELNCLFQSDSLDREKYELDIDNKNKMRASSCQISILSIFIDNIVRYIIYIFGAFYSNNTNFAH